MSTTPLFCSYKGQPWNHGYVRRAIERHRIQAGLSPFEPGERAHPQKWSGKERAKFLQTPVRPYDQSIVNSRLILGLGLHCGLRAEEMIKLQIKHVDLYQKQLYVQGKGRRNRQVPLNEYMVTLLTPIVRGRDHNTYLLVRRDGSRLRYKSIREITVKLAETAGITYKRVTPHTLRHSFATHLKDHGVSIHSIMQLLGHSSIAETERYLHTGEEQLEAAVELLVQESAEK